MNELCACSQARLIRLSASVVAAPAVLAELAERSSSDA
jgi:hypothetical protein